MKWDWRDDAACRGEDPESFFIVEHSASANQRREERKTICWTCPVRPWCLITAVRQRSPWGVVGGYDMEDLTSEKRRAAEAEAMIELWTSDGIGPDEVREALLR